MRLPSAIRAGVVSAVLLSALGRPAAAQPPPPPPTAPAPQAGQPRDPHPRPPAEPAGTGVIRGRVVAADTGSPIRRANVNLVPMSVPTVTTTRTGMNGVPAGLNASARLNIARPRTVTTDAQGAFEFTGLPAGIYGVTASPGQYSAQYLSMAFGGKRPGGLTGPDLGQPIDLAAGQAFDRVVIALARGAVITGRVTDETGGPLARVQVYTMMYSPGSARGQRTGGGSATDDLGQFRIYGLMPGEYAVVAEARENTFVPPNAAPESEEDQIGFMTTFYPATADEAAAQRVRARAGAETPGVEIRLVSGRLFRISGIVTDSQGRPARTNGSLTKRMAGGASSNFGFNSDDQGRFQMRNIPPGNYRLTVRQSQSGPRKPDGPPGEPGEFANVPVAITGDLENLLVITTPGVTIAGQIVFEQGPPPKANQTSPQPVRVYAALGDPADNAGIGPGPAPTVAGPDMTFTMKGLIGEYLLRANASNGPTQYLKSVSLNGDDITDTPREFKQGDRVIITLSSRASSLEGAVTDDQGKPVTDADLILFSEDKGSWRSNSIRTHRQTVDPTGHYRIMGLVPGRYFLTAVPRDRLSFGTLDAGLFEQLSKEATSVVVGEDEQRQVDLKLVTAPHR